MVANDRVNRLVAQVSVHPVAEEFGVGLCLCKSVVVGVVRSYISSENCQVIVKSPDVFSQFFHTRRRKITLILSSGPCLLGYIIRKAKIISATNNILFYVTVILRPNSVVQINVRICYLKHSESFSFTFHAFI